MGERRALKGVQRGMNEMIRKTGFLTQKITACLLLLLLLAPTAAVGEGMPDRVVDGHLHYLDFIQQTDGFEKLIEKMDQCGVDRAVIFGMAMTRQWNESASASPNYYMSASSRYYYYSATDHLLLKALSEQPENVRERFYPFVCGVNPNDQHAASQLRTLLELYPGQIYGIGELMSRHDELTAQTYGEAPRADHPALLSVYDLAAEYGLPVLIHHNIAEVELDDPIYLQEMKNALEHNRDARIIWAHVGVSRHITISNLLMLADQMLAQNPNLYYDISWVVYEDYILPSLESWAALIEKYPERFIIGSDKVGYWGTYPDEILKYQPLIDLLTPAATQNLCADNILRLIDPAALISEGLPFI